MEKINFESLAIEKEKELKSGFGREWLEREIKAGRTRQAGEPASVLLDKIWGEKEKKQPSKKLRKLKAGTHG